MRLQDRVLVFQDRLQQVITQSGLNRSAFANSIKVDRSTLSQLLTPENVRLPRADTVASIAENYQVSIDWLLGLTEGGAMQTDLVPEAVEIDDYSTDYFEYNLEWHRQAAGYKVRYVPTTLPDLLKTETVAEYEFNRYGSGKVDQSVRDNHLILLQQRHPGSEMEVCMSVQHLDGFAKGEGIWDLLSAKDRRAQLQQMIELNRELYPGFRWYLFDGRQTYSSSFTIYGPMRASLFLGHLYIVVNSLDHMRKLTSRFDDLIKMAVVHPHELDAHLNGLLEQCK